MKTVLMVAEKPSLAQSLAQILSNGQMKSRKGANGVCQVHEFNGNFNSSETVKFKMTSVCGHVLSVDFLGKYNNWDRVDPSELFKAPIEKKEANEKLKISWFLNIEAKGCSYLVLWLDCDKEGENICFEVINAVKNSMIPLNRYEQTIFRAKFSAITDRDIKLAMKNLGQPNENESRSVDARQELDLRIGCSFTRFQTKFFQGKYGNLDSSLISYGPCQTPTLGFCVDRHDRIQSFKPEPYWNLQCQVEHSSEKILNLEWERGRIFDKDVGQMFLNTIKKEKSAVVTNVSCKEKVKQRPAALNTVELMRVASSGLNIGPHHAMQIAERLYTQGYISYPRTETTHYPENFDLIGTLRQQKTNPDWGPYVSSLLDSGINRPRKGTDVGDHPPITPTKSATRQQLDGDSWRIYDYITRHFIATLSKDCKYEVTTIHFDIGAEKFSSSGKIEVDAGFTQIMSWQNVSSDQSLPVVSKGDSLALTNVKLCERQTAPPEYLTEAELITLMEKHGIGTDASIPVHINNIGLRNYVSVTSGRRLVPTPLGIVLVHGYQKIDPDLVLPTMRSAVEEQLNLIAQGKVDFHLVLQHTLKIFTLKFHYFVQNVTGMDELFEVSFSPLSETGKPMCRCGKCRRFLKYVAAKPSRLHCSQCDETYSLPQNGNIKLYKELKCPLDDFELLVWSGGVKGKSYPFCPYCYNNPPFHDMRKLSGCNNCSHPTCPHAVANTGVCACDKCANIVSDSTRPGTQPQNGILVLDPGSGPKWKLVCNKCDLIVKLFEDASKVNVESEESCEKCNSLLLSVEYKAEKSKLSDGALSATGCIFCDPELTELIEKKIAITSNFRSNVNRGRGGKRGRGRRRGGRRGR